MPRLSDLRPVLAALALAVATAAAAEPIVPAIGPSGEAYRQAIAWRGVDAAIVYADPAEPLTLLPSRATAPEPPRRQSVRVPDTVVRVVVIVAFAILVVFLIRVAGVRGVHFARTPGEAALSEDATTAPAARGAPALPAGLDPIRRDPDRQRAIVALLQLVLARVAATHGLHLLPSWTARDALRQIPRGWVHRPALAELTRTAEEAHFGGYPVSEDRFATHLRAAETILGRGRA